LKQEDLYIQETLNTFAAKSEHEETSSLAQVLRGRRKIENLPNKETQSISLLSRAMAMRETSPFINRDQQLLKV